MQSATSPRKYQQAGWIILLVVTSLLSLNSLYFAIAGVTAGTFENDTGVAWNVFSSDYPTVATAMNLIERLNGTGYFGTSLFAALVTFFGLRKRVLWAWYVLWVFPGVLLLGSIWFFTHEQAEIGAFYLIVAVIAMVGLLLPFRLFFPRIAR